MAVEGINPCDRASRLCKWCDEVLEPDVVRTDWMHAECAMRGVVGSVAHQEQRCSCFVEGSTAGDDPALSKREAARAAAALWRARNERTA